MQREAATAGATAFSPLHLLTLGDTLAEDREIVRRVG